MNVSNVVDYNSPIFKIFFVLLFIYFKIEYLKKSLIKNCCNNKNLDILSFSINTFIELQKRQQQQKKEHPK